MYLKEGIIQFSYILPVGLNLREFIILGMPAVHWSSHAHMLPSVVAHALDGDTFTN